MKKKKKNRELLKFYLELHLFINFNSKLFYWTPNLINVILFKKNLKQLLKRKGYLIIFKKILLKNYADYHDFTNTYLHEKALVPTLSFST